MFLSWLIFVTVLLLRALHCGSLQRITILGYKRSTFLHVKFSVKQLRSYCKLNTMYAAYFWVYFFAENPAVLHNEFLERTFCSEFCFSALFLTLNNAA
jgi:hypothetical protein